jgi:hypothetical protein
MPEKLERYVLRRIEALKNQQKSAYQIIEQLGAVSDFGNYRRPDLRKLLGLDRPI